MSLIRSILRLTSAAAATTLLAAVPALAAAQDSVTAVWVPKHIEFIYQGFTTHYSCDGLQDQIGPCWRSSARRISRSGRWPA